MKRILVVLFSLICFIGYAQTPYPTPYTQQGSPSTLVQVRGGWKADSTAMMPKYVDTITANLYKTKLYAGSIIFTTGDGNYWYRSADAARWLLFGNSVTNCLGTQLISGSITWSGSGLIFDATDLDYSIICTRYSSSATTLTLSTADPTYARIDKLYADITGNVGVITGTPAPNPQEPVINPLSQLDMGIVYIPAGSTVPAGTTQTVIYNENVEWSGTSDVPSIDFAYATNPYIGSLSTYLPSAPNSSYVEWQSGGIDYLFSEAQYLKFWVRLNADFTVDPLSFLDVTFEYTDVTVSQTLAVGNGDYNMDYSLINQWQLVSIPLTGITTFGAEFNSVHFVINSAPASFQLDYVYLLETATVPPVIGNYWGFNGNSVSSITNPVLGTTSDNDLTIVAGDSVAIVFPSRGITQSGDSAHKQLLWDSTTKRAYWGYQPTIYALDCINIFDSIGKRWIRDTCSGGGGGSSTPFGYTLSTTQPTDTSVGWINLNYNILQCYPVQYHVNGAWTQVDTIGGQFYDAIGKVFSRGYPYKIIATGQSNLGGSYIGEVANPNAYPYNGYYGDTIPAKAVAAWNNNSNIWVVAKIRDTPFQYSSGANYLLLAAKKINEQTGRSVRIVTYPQGGTGLQCWAGVPGTPPQDSTCYNEFKSRIQASGLTHPDLFIWAQSEAGIEPVPTNTTYFDKWKEMVDSMIARDHLMDTTTLKILMASGDTLTNPNTAYSLSNGTSAGEGALRALAATNDRTIKYVDAMYYQTPLSEALHFTPKGHEELARRLYNSIAEGQKNPSRDMMGYGGISAWKFSGNQQKLAATGLTFVSNAGREYIDLEGTATITRFTSPRPNASSQYSTGLYFDPVGTNTVRLYHFNNSTKIQLEDTRVLTSNIVALQSVEAYSGGDPEFTLNDLTLNKKWKFQMLNGSNELHFDYDGNDYFHFTKTGELGIGSLPGHVPDSALRVVKGIWGEGGVRFSGLPSNQTYSKSLGVTNNGTLYLKDTLAVSGVYALINANTTGTAGGLSATLVPGSGGTGFSTYTTGDLIYASATNTLSKRGIGATGDYMAVVGGVPTWQALSANTYNVGGFNSIFTGNHRSATTTVGTGTNAPTGGSILEIASTTKGLLLPRMTKTQRDAISGPAAGLMIYQTDNTPGLRVYNGTNWMRYTETAD